MIRSSINITHHFKNRSELIYKHTDLGPRKCFGVFNKLIVCIYSY